MRSASSNISTSTRGRGDRSLRHPDLPRLPVRKKEKIYFFDQVIQNLTSNNKQNNSSPQPKRAGNGVLLPANPAPVRLSKLEIKIYISLRKKVIIDVLGGKKL